MRSGVIVAGGYSTRFGDRDKATAELQGRPLVARVADGVAPVVDDLVVNCRREQRDALAAALEGRADRFAVDPVPDRGPVAGLRTGLAAARGDRAVAVACDVPRIRPGPVRTLFDVLEAAGADAAVPRVAGCDRPLAAVYRTDPTVAAAESVLSEDSAAMTDLLGALETVAVPDPAPPAAFADVDEPADLRALTAGEEPAAAAADEPSSVAEASSVGEGASTGRPSAQ